MCDICKIFGHVHDHCPKVSPSIVTTSNVVSLTVEITNDGFQTVGNKKKRKDSVTNLQHLSENFAHLFENENVDVEVKRIVDEIRVRRGEMKEKKEMLDLVNNVVVKISQVFEWCGV
nr:hypothetical protein [Tanacetum cinerariifolium]